MSRSTRALAACAAALALTPAAAQAQVQVGSSGWAWGNPSPQGNTVLASSFAGAQGYAAGRFGTLIATGDGGSTFVGLRSGTFTDLHEVQAINATSVFAGGGCVGRRSDDAGRTFTRVAFTPVESSCRQALADAWWVSPTTGYLTLTDGTVLFTANNGQTFSPRTQVPNADPNAGGTGDVQFLSETVGFATTGGRIYRTTDGANSWNEVAVAQRSIRDLLFIDPLNGFAVGAGGLFLTTTDGGATWAPQPLGAGDDLNDITCNSPTSCLMTAGDGKALVRTTDGGATSTRVTVSTLPIFALAFATPERVVAMGERGATALSGDGGATFTPLGSSLQGTYTALVAGGGRAAYAVGADGALAKTTDGGATFQRGNVPTSEDLLDVAFPTATAGFALDVAGGLFGTADGGASWRTLDAGAPSAPSDVLAPNPQTVLVVGSFGVRRSTDAGESFSAVAGRDLRRLTAADDAAGAVFVHGSDRLRRSTDRGARWSKVRLPTRRTRIRRLDFVSAGTGYLIDTAGRLWRTDNGGRRWAELDAVGFGDPDNVVFGSRSKGYLVVDRFGSPSVEAGWLLRTEDAGRTWYPQFVVSEQIPTRGVVAGADGTDFLLGGSNGLLFSRSGGASGTPSTLTISTQRRTLRRAGTIAVTGRLAPGAANDEVTVSRRAPGRTGWQSQTVKTASNGAFTTRWRVTRGKTAFVAQWPGNFRSRGDGSEVLTVRVR